nr:MAG TPA: hypothetical protein [Bacteriophage sp.]
MFISFSVKCLYSQIFKSQSSIFSILILFNFFT